MNTYFAYVRVSTIRQGDEGASLPEQRRLIQDYADRHHLYIQGWFEERLSAGNRGRPVFSQVVKEIVAGRAAGLILHKIDRGARNLRDWADLGELIDRGVDVRFVQDGLDLRTRGGRLAADIQAVVAADFLRNLREETRKGFYGRLHQGLYPLPAPFGYLDNGGGQVKTIHPELGPLVTRAFALYASGDHTLEQLSHLLDNQIRGKRFEDLLESVVKNGPSHEIASIH